MTEQIETKSFEEQVALLQEQLRTSEQEQQTDAARLAQLKTQKEAKTEAAPLPEVRPQETATPKELPKPKEKIPRKSRHERRMERLATLSDKELAQQFLDMVREKKPAIDLKKITDHKVVSFINKLVAGSVASATINRIVRGWAMGWGAPAAGFVGGAAAGAAVGAGVGFLSGYRRGFREAMNIDEIFKRDEFKDKKIDELEEKQISELGTLLKRGELYATTAEQRAKLDQIKKSYLDLHTNDARQKVIEDNKALLEQHKDNPQERAKAIAEIFIKAQRYKSQRVDQERQLIASSKLREEAKRKGIDLGKRGAKRGALAGAGIGGVLGLISGLLTTQPRAEAAATQPAQAAPPSAPPAPGAPESGKEFLDRIFEHNVSGDHLGMGEGAIDPAEALRNAKEVTYQGDIGLDKIIEALKSGQLPEEMHKFLGEKGIDLGLKLQNGETLGEFARKMFEVQGVDANTMQDAIYHLFSSSERITEDTLNQLLTDQEAIKHLAHTDYTGIKDVADEPFRKAAAETFAKWLNADTHHHTLTSQDVNQLNQLLGLSGENTILPGFGAPSPGEVRLAGYYPPGAEAGATLAADVTQAKAEGLLALIRENKTELFAGALESLVAMLLARPREEAEERKPVEEEKLDPHVEFATLWNQAVDDFKNAFEKPEAKDQTPEEKASQAHRRAHYEKIINYVSQVAQDKPYFLSSERFHQLPQAHDANVRFGYKIIVGNKDELLKRWLADPKQALIFDYEVVKLDRKEHKVIEQGQRPDKLLLLDLPRGILKSLNELDQVVQ